MNLRSHPLFALGGGMSMPSGMSAEDRKGLLEFESSLAEERDKAARKFQEDSQRRMEAQEKEIRKQTELAEQERVATLEEMESAAAGAVDTAVEASMKDRERRLTGMWGSLSAGTSAETSPSVTEDRPQ
tara:strand:+ start:1509 stop:1895 length:387 start_codon:yes stop_codon:yes gene_type:complete